MPRKTTYEGTAISITFDGNRCIHARHCVLGQPDVFQANAKGAWIQPDNATAEALAQIAHACPSGAITYKRHDGADDEEAPQVNTIRVRENGPLAVHAEIVLKDQPDGFRATLCRCGASQKKPYCDGSHSAVDFAASGEPATQESDPLEVPNGELSINPLPNGPLLVNGNVEVISGTGRSANRAQKTALCRCGASQNKPYCDGSHTQVGFEAE